MARGGLLGGARRTLVIRGWSANRKFVKCRCKQGVSLILRHLGAAHQDYHDRDDTRMVTKGNNDSGNFIRTARTSCDRGDPPIDLISCLVSDELSRRNVSYMLRRWSR